MPKPKKIRVVYGVIADPSGAAAGECVVFGLRDEAHRVANLRDALRTATTWGRLRELVDAASYAEAMHHCSAFYESYEEFCDTGGLEPASAEARREYLALAIGQRKPCDDDPFERSQLRALVDGDWPLPLDRGTDSWMPATILGRYATSGASLIGGTGHTFEPKDRGTIARELRKHGFTVRRDDAVVRAAQSD